MGRNVRRGIANLIDDAGLGAHRAVIESLYEDCIGLRPKSGSAKAPVGSSKFGGLPDLLPDVDWPVWEEPLGFVAQVNFADAAKIDSSGLLPKQGLLSLFADSEDGMFVDDQNDGRHWRLLFTPGTDLKRLKRREAPEDLPEYNGRWKEHRIELFARPSVPSPDDYLVDPVRKISASDDSGSLYEQYSELTDEVAALFGNESKDEGIHQILGHPRFIQDDHRWLMHGVHCGLKGRRLEQFLKTMGPSTKDSAAREKRETALKELSDWVLLLQVASDDRIGFMWCDYGLLYVWIRKEDLLAQQWAKARLWVAYS